MARIIANRCRYNAAMFESWLLALLNWFALPQHGLPAVFVVSFVSATLLPMGSEPIVFGLVKLQPELFWPTVLVATLGNTLGGTVSYAMGYGVKWMVVHKTHRPDAPTRVFAWFKRFGPAACVLSWLPVVGDPLCAVAGWLKLSFWPCLLWMALGKFLRYLTLTAALVWMF